MSKRRKRNRSGKLALVHRRHKHYLEQSLRTPDGLRALGEFFMYASHALSSFLIATFILFNFLLDEQSFAATMFRVTAALALINEAHRSALSCWRKPMK
jgi:hypothetical protein